MNAVPDVNPDAPRENLCRVCALDLFLYGLKDWWIQERAKGFVEEAVLNRKDCPQGNSCPLQAQDPGKEPAPCVGAGTDLFAIAAHARQCESSLTKNPSSDLPTS